MFNKSSEEFVMRNEIIITDWDGVIQYIDYQWTIAFKELYDEVYSKFFDYKHLENLSIENLDMRDEYFFNKWLAKEGHILTDHEYKLFEMPYVEDVFFYNKCPMLSMFEALINLSKQNYCTNITILTQTQFEGGDPRKQFIFEKIIQPISDKFKLIQIPLDVPKWKYMKDNNLYFTIFIDDRGDIIRDVAEKVDMTHKKFLIPKLGYNYELRADKDFIAKLNMHGSQLLQYDQQIIDFFPETRANITKK